MIAELAPGLYRWAAPHPEWEPDHEPGSPFDWPQMVGSVACALDGDRLLVVDPLAPEDPGFWDEMDALVERHGPAVTVLETVRFHSRSGEAFVERYGARRPSIGDAGLPGVEALAIPGADETMVYLPAYRALVTGDRIMGDDAGGLRLCPQSWLEYIPKHLDQPPVTREQMRERLRALLAERDVEMVLTSHGEPVLMRGRAALDRVLTRA